MVCSIYHQLAKIGSDSKIRTKTSCFPSTCPNREKRSTNSLPPVIECSYIPLAPPPSHFRENKPMNCVQARSRLAMHCLSCVTANLFRKRRLSVKMSRFDPWHLRWRCQALRLGPLAFSFLCTSTRPSSITTKEFSCILFRCRQGWTAYASNCSRHCFHR